MGFPEENIKSNGYIESVSVFCEKTRPLDVSVEGSNEESTTDVDEDSLSEQDTLVNATEITRAPNSLKSAIAETIS